MRYVKPDGPKTATIANEVIPFGDYVPSFFLGLGSLGSGITGSILAFTEHPLFALLILPLIICLVFLISWARNTADIGSCYSGDPKVNSAFALYGQIKGEFTDQLALPLVQKVFQHAQEGGHDYMGRCNAGACDERITTLRQLIPATKSVRDKSDVQAALDFINARKELEQ